MHTDSGPLRRVIEAAKTACGRSLKALSVLAEQRDPYRLDTPANHGDGAWVADQFERTGRLRIHIRGLHYAIVARGGILRPDGRVYVNDNDNWEWLQEAAKAARWLGHLPFTAIVDERNAAPVIHRRERYESETWLDVGIEVQIPDDLQPVPKCTIAAHQPYSLVIAGEKSSLGEVVLPIAEEFEADLYLPTGEMSDTMIHQIAADAIADGRPLRVFYLSDFDPTGYEMPANVGRKLQALRDLSFPDLDYQVISVALDDTQVRDLGLPSTPLKEAERRSDRWRAHWGVEQTEIDALATLAPDTLRQIVTDALSPFFDETLDDRVADAEEEWRKEALEAFKAQTDQDQIERLKEAAKGRLGELREAIEAINRDFKLAADDIDLPEVDEVEARIDPDAHPMPLVSSAWSWIDQTEALITRKSYGR